MEWFLISHRPKNLHFCPHCLHNVTALRHAASHYRPNVTVGAVQPAPLVAAMTELIVAPPPWALRTDRLRYILRPSSALCDCVHGL
jgi:hypothetical protein